MGILEGNRVSGGILEGDRVSERGILEGDRVRGHSRG